MAPSVAEIIVGYLRTFDKRLRVIEGQLGMLIRAAEVEADDRDLEGEIAKAYRRGYLTGHHQQAAGIEPDAEYALAHRRRPRRPQPDKLGPVP